MHGYRLRVGVHGRLCSFALTSRFTLLGRAALRFRVYGLRFRAEGTLLVKLTLSEITGDRQALLLQVCSPYCRMFHRGTPQVITLFLKRVQLDLFVAVIGIPAGDPATWHASAWTLTNPKP